MAFDILYPDESNDQVRRHSSIDQFAGFLSTWKQGGWAPIVFDQLDGIGECSGIKSHPVVISWGGDLNYIYPEAHCVYASDHFIFVDKEGVEQKLLPECFGGKGEFYDVFVKKFSFINYDDASVGVHNVKRTRVGLSYVKASETLPGVD